MAKAKKLLLTVLSLAFSVVMCLSVVACDFGGGSNNNDDDNGGNNAIAYEVTEAQFNAALDIKGAPFKATIVNSYEEVGGESGSENMSAEYAVTKLKIVQPYEGQQMTIYFEKDGDNYYQYFEVAGVYVKTPTTEEASFQDFLAQYNPAFLFAQPEAPSFSDFEYNSNIKAYVYSEVDDNGTGTFKIFFENGKIVKTENSSVMVGTASFTMTTTYTYDNVTVTLPEVGNLGGNGGNEDVGGGDDNQEEHVCDMQATEWFDAEHRYPKTFECSDENCNEEIKRTDIEISTVEEFVMLANDLTQYGYDIGREKIKIVNDLDLTGAICPALTVNNMRKETKIYADEEVVITGLNKALICEVKTGLVLENITIDGLETFSSNGLAGGLIDSINIGSTAMKKNVTIKNCKVINSSINAITHAGDNACYAGAIYGKVADNSALDTLIVDKCVVDNTTVSSDAFAGGIAGAMSNVSAGKNPAVNFNYCEVSNTTVISGKERGAGLVLGVVGYGKCLVDQDTSDFAMTSLNNVTATGHEVPNIELYGITGWASENEKGTITMMAAMLLTFDRAVNQLP